MDLVQHLGARLLESERRESERVGDELERRFATFVGTHRERARRLAYRLVGGDEAAAEDVAQDAFVRAYSALDRFRGESTLDTWFYRILVRQAYSYRRWRGVRLLWTADADPDAMMAREASPGDPVLRRRIATALDALSRLQREVFVLVHFEEFTVKETALILEKAEGTVKSHLHRALAKLRVELADVWVAAGSATEEDS